MGPIQLSLAVFVVIWVFFYRRVSRGAQINNQGLMQLGEGRLSEALKNFETSSRLMRLNPMPRLNVGVALVYLWRLDEAEVALRKAIGGFQGGALRVVALPTLAFVAAMRGDLKALEQYGTDIAAMKLEGNALWAVSLAIRAARQQNWSALLQTLTLARTRPLGGPARAVADALRAWATEQTTGVRSSVDAVGVFGETGPQALERWWPEFAQFVASHAG